MSPSSSPLLSLAVSESDALRDVRAQEARERRREWKPSTADAHATPANAHPHTHASTSSRTRHDNSPAPTAGPASAAASPPWHQRALAAVTGGRHGASAPSTPRRVRSSTTSLLFLRAEDLEAAPKSWDDFLGKAPELGFSYRYVVTVVLR